MAQNVVIGRFNTLLGQTARVEMGNSPEILRHSPMSTPGLLTYRKQALPDRRAGAHLFEQLRDVHRLVWWNFSQQMGFQNVQDPR